MVEIACMGEQAAKQVQRSRQLCRSARQCSVIRPQAGPHHRLWKVFVGRLRERLAQFWAFAPRQDNDVAHQLKSANLGSVHVGGHPAKSMLTQSGHRRNELNKGSPGDLLQCDFRMKLIKVLMGDFTGMA